MSFFQASLMGKQIDSVHVDSEVTYIILNDGTCVSIRGLVIIEPGRVLNAGTERGKESWDWTPRPELGPSIIATHELRRFLADSPEERSAENPQSQ